MTSRIGVSALALAIGLAAAPQLFAQSGAQIVVCRDGQVTSTRYGARACDRDGGIDRKSTRLARRNGVNGVNGANQNRGVYNGGVYNGGVYNGSTNGNRSVYGGAYPNGSNRSVYGGSVNGNGSVGRDRDDDDDDRGDVNDRGSVNDRGDINGRGNVNGRGHAYGHYKAKRHKGGDDDE